MRREALRAAVAAKIAAGELVVIEALDGHGRQDQVARDSPGRARADRQSPPCSWRPSLDEPLRRAARNVPWLAVEPPSHVSVYQLLRAHRVVVERAALLALEEALAP